MPTIKKHRYRNSFLIEAIMRKQIGSWIVEISKENKLGEGGMGEVYLATHSKLETPAAIKFLPSALANDSNFSKRFTEEAKTQARLKHPNIALIMDCVEENEQLFLVIEYLEGGTIADIIDKAKSPIEQTKALKWIKQVLSALNYAHQKGVIHRDIKSTNIMLDQHGNAKVLDFGIALEMNDIRLTKTGVSVGTPHYMSPEQIRRPKDIDHRTDVYSTAIVLYELLTGKVPFDGDSDFDVKFAQVQEPPPSLRNINPFIAQELEEIIIKGLAKDPSQRYSGCGEFLQVVENYQKVELVKSIKSSPVAIASSDLQKIMDKIDLSTDFGKFEHNYQVTEINKQPLVQQSIKLEPQPIKPNSIVKLNLPLASNNVNSQNEDLSLPNDVKWEFVHIKAGEFNMGSNNIEDEKPLHRVKISKEYELGKYVVTQKQWIAVMNRNTSHFVGSTLPVEQVSWENAQEFISKLNIMSNKYLYSLPTEAEWEYAARAGTEGNDISNLDEIAWYKTNSENKTHEVGSKKVNAWGLYDMQGNVYEWCKDNYHVSYYRTRPSLDIDPEGPASGTYRVRRGGCWLYESAYCSLSHRSHNWPNEQVWYVGFRLLRRPKQG